MEPSRHHNEMSLRDRFALDCHAAILSYIGPFSGTQPEQLARVAVRHADALIKELAA